MESLQLGLFGRTSPACCPPRTTPSETCWADWSELIPPSLRADGGQTRAWLLDPDELPRGACSTPSISEWPSAGDVSLCSLAEVLEPGPLPTRYYLSARAALGILRRAERRGKALPEVLRRALESASKALP